MNRNVIVSKLTVICIAISLYVSPAAAEDLCIDNKSPQSLIMSLDNPGYKGGGWLLQGNLESGQSLCCSSQTSCQKFIDSAASKGHKFSIHAFEDEDALEGCSILTKAGTTVKIDLFAVYDRCAWAIEDIPPS